MGKFKFLAGVAMVASLALSGVANASVITTSTNNPLAFSWSFSSIAGLLTGNGSLTVSGFNSSVLSVAITLNNTSGLASNRLTSFGFGINPNATSVSFSDAADAGMINASLASIPSLAAIEVCAWGGSNCSGGGSGGILGGGNDSFAVLLAGPWGSSVDVAPIGFKYQTGNGSFEFTTGCLNAQIGACGEINVPEPSSMWLMLIGLLGLGAFASTRKLSV